MESNIDIELLAHAISWQVISYLKQDGTLDKLKKEVQSDALATLEQIQCILNNDTLDDPECFQRIDYIVETFHAYGISTARHDF